VRTLRSILRISLFGSLLLSVWFAVYFSGLLLSKTDNKNIQFIPDDASFALLIDGGQISETTLYTVLLEAKDEEIIRLLTQSLKKRTSSDVDFKNPGINALSTIVIFTAPVNGENVNGVLFNLFNEKAFRSSFKRNLDARQVCFAKSDVGVLLTAGKKSKLSARDLADYAERLLSKTEAPHQLQQVSKAEANFANLHLHKAVAKKHDQFHEIDLSFGHTDRSFLIDGSLTNRADFEDHFLSHQLKPKGLHISSRIFAQEWADSLRRLLSFLPVDLPEITAFSLNYEGAKVVNHSSGFFVIPQIELVVQCKEEFSIQQLFSTGTLQSELDYKLKNNELWIQNERLYFQQLSPKSFYIGIKALPEFDPLTPSVVLAVKGDLHPLVNIKGGGLMTAFLEMLPAYKASRILTESSRGIDLKVSKISKQRCTIKGELLFKEGHYPMAEVLRFLLVGQFVE